MKFFFAAIVILIIGISDGYSSERRSAAGFGTQYGGAFGWQGSIVNGPHRRSVGVGIIGASVGYDYKLGESISAGTSLSLFGDVILGTLRLQYYTRGTYKIGWAFGVDVFLAATADSPGALFSIGYGYK